jgi:putative dehydrogenase
MKGSVGVIGLGIMGGAIAGNLVADGWDVIGYDPDAAACGRAEAAGVGIAADIPAVLTKAEVILTSLPSPKAVIATAETIVAAAARRHVIVELSTLAIEDKMRFASVLESTGHVAIDCPISGTGAQARNRDLVLYASGDPAEIRLLHPVLLGFAREAHDVGTFGNGSRMKFVANLLVAIHNVAAAEAMVLGMMAGLDPQQLVALAGAGAGASRMFTLRAPMMAENRYDEATMKMSVWQKDMTVITEFAAQLGSPTPLLTATVPLYARAMEQGYGESDTAAVCAVLEEMTDGRLDRRRQNQS